MQAKVPLFSQPPFRNLEDGEYLTLLDLRGVDDNQVTRLVTVFAQFYNDPPDGSSGGVALVNYDGVTAPGPTNIVGGASISDSNAQPAKLADQLPIRGDTVLQATCNITGTGRVTLFGYYTIAGASGERGTNVFVPLDFLTIIPTNFSGDFAYLDKRALQPDNEVVEDMSFPSDAGDPVHVVPANAQSIDDVTVDIAMFSSTEAKLYFTDYPDNFVAVRPFAVIGDLLSNSGLMKVLESIPFRAEGTLMLSATTPVEEPPARAVGYFVRY